MGIHIHFVWMPGECLDLPGKQALLMLSSSPEMHVKASEYLKEEKPSQLAQLPYMTLLK